MKKRHLSEVTMLVYLLLFFFHQGYAQQWAPAIEDNSFYIEEAFNQEVRVVQHIGTGFFSPSTPMELSFSQEWPLGSQTHQLSFTVPYLSPVSTIKGIGDIMIHYRYQLWNGDDWAWCSPRLSLIIPTGSQSKGTGYGSVGVQFNLPMSKRVSNSFIIHTNVGLTHYLSAKQSLITGTEVERSLTSIFIGGSGIVLLSETFNVLCEVLYNNVAEISTVTGKVERRNEIILSPGIRYAINTGDLQIVPGIASPIFFEKNSSETGIFLYLSFEHPF